MKEPWLKESSIRHAILLLKSYRKWTGGDLVPPAASDKETAQLLFAAPFVVVSHGTEKDPILNYGNGAALDLWDMTWDSFIHTPSRLTTEPLQRSERAVLLKEVAQKGFSENYRGVRVTSSGRRFRIENAVVWNLENETGEYCGQAATFDHWTFL